MSNNIVSWINSGFKGSPAFVTDFGAFMRNIADRTAGDFIWGSQLGFLCSPFSIDLRLILDIQYRKGRDYDSKCTLTGVADNINGFFAGDFLSGGWDSWVQITSNPVNNPYGSLLLAQEELALEINSANGQKVKLLDFSKGFLNVEKCVTFENKHRCTTVTPGTAIEAQLNATLDSGRQRIQVADEFNEIVAALFAQLAHQAFAGVGGLLGLTEPGYGDGSGTYYSQLANDPTQIGATFTGKNPITDAIAVERRYAGLQSSIPPLIKSAQTYKDDVYGKDSQCYTDAFPETLTTYLVNATLDAAHASDTVLTLEDMLTKYDNAKSGVSSNSIQIQSDVMQEFLNMQGDGSLHTEPDNVTLEQLTIPQIEDEITAYKTVVDTACSLQSGGA
jgi:hypothetical protein